MNKVRSLHTPEFVAAAEWVAALPLLERYGTTPDSLQRQWLGAHQRGETLLAVEDAAGAVCGVAWLMPHGAFGRSPYLRFIGVHPAHGGAGVGGALLEAVEQVAEQEGRELFLLVSDFNSGAQRFYTRHGYHQIGAIPGYVVPDITELIFWKPLSARRSL